MVNYKVFKLKYRKETTNFLNQLVKFNYLFTYIHIAKYLFTNSFSYCFSFCISFPFQLFEGRQPISTTFLQQCNVWKQSGCGGNMPRTCFILFITENRRLGVQNGMPYLFIKNFFFRFKLLCSRKSKRVYLCVSLLSVIQICP